TPTLTAGTGTYQTSQQVGVTAASGATVTYTINGGAATELLTGQTIFVDESLTLAVVASKTNLLPSAPASAVYTMQLAQPVLAPGSLTFTGTATDVSMTAGS